jgi:hypothetical protein
MKPAMSDPKGAARLYHNACREAKLLLTVWALALVWTVSYCYLHGYRHPSDGWAVQRGLAAERAADDLQTILGFPDWVFIGILIPWAVCTLFTVVFSLFLMSDDDLGAEGWGRSADGH